jgi:hypothetical protein
MRWGAWIAALIVLLALAASAHAGTYVVRACDTPAGHFPNRSWSYGTGQYFGGRGACAKAGEDLATFVWPNSAAIPPDVAGGLAFTAPPGAAIADFRIDRNVYFYNPTVPDAPRSPYVLFELGATAFAGAGDTPRRESVNAFAPSHWYGYPSQAADTGQAWLALEDFPALKSYRGGATTLRITTGCAAGATACSLRSDGWITARVFGAEVTIDDPRRPVITAAGFRPDGVTFSVTDNAGIASATLLDVTDAAAAGVVAARDYRTGRSAAGETCDPARTQPCPTELRDEPLQGAVPSGRRSLVLRVVDVAGNVTQSAAGVVQVGSPATSCSPGGPVVRAWLAGRRAARSVRYGRSAPVSGRVLAADGRTPAAGALVQLFTRVRHGHAGWLGEASTTTRSDGRFWVAVAPGPSRAVRAVLVDGAAVRCSRTLRLAVRAGVTLRISRAAVPRGGRARFSGRLRGGPARGGRLVIVQAFDGGRWRTFASARTGKSGRWRTSYRFSDDASGSFRFRAVVRSQAGYPYASGTSRVRLVRVG